MCRDKAKGFEICLKAGWFFSLSWQILGTLNAFTRARLTNNIVSYYILICIRNEEPTKLRSTAMYSRVESVILHSNETFDVTWCLNSRNIRLFNIGYLNNSFELHGLACKYLSRWRRAVNSWFVGSIGVVIWHCEASGCLPRLQGSVGRAHKRRVAQRGLVRQDRLPLVLADGEP